MKNYFNLFSALFLFAATALMSCSTDDNVPEGKDENPGETAVADRDLQAVWYPLDQPTGAENSIYIVNFTTDDHGTLLMFNNDGTTEYCQFGYAVSRKKEVKLDINSSDRPTRKAVYAYDIDSDTLTLQAGNEMQRFVRGSGNPILGEWKSVESQKGKVEYDDLEYSTFRFYTFGADNENHVECEFRSKDVIDMRTNRPSLNREHYAWSALNLSQIFIKDFMDEGRVFDVRYRYDATKGKVWLELSGDYFNKTFTRYEKIESEPGTVDSPALIQRSARANIFTPVEYSLDGSFSGTDIYAYDSIVWHIDGIEGRFYIRNKDAAPSTITLSWTYYFLNPGRYASHLDFYKGGRMVGHSATETEIASNRDFLDVVWDSPTYDYDNRYRANVLDPRHEMGIQIIVADGTKTALLRLLRAPECGQEQARQDADYLNAYMTNLFGSALNLAEASAAIENEYDRLFNYRHDSAGSSMKILKIWKTARSNIALVSIVGGRQNLCAVIAEPAG